MNFKPLMTGLTSAAIAITLAACSAPASESATQAATETATQTASNQSQSSATKNGATSTASIASGTFDGRSDHITTGRVTVEKTPSGYQLRFAGDFSLDGAPDPVVALGNGETYSVENKLGALKNITGAQTYALPASFKPGQFNEVYVWCEKFSVPLGVATLTRS